MRYLFHVYSIGSNLSNSGSPTATVDQIKEMVRDWKIEYKIPFRALNGILKIMSKILPDLPTDGRSIMKTPRSRLTRTLASGQYAYIGLRRNIQKIAPIECIQNVSDLKIQLHIDGFKPFHSSNQKIWTVLCRLIELVLTTPFISV